MNLLPMPRELDLGTETVALVEPRVSVGVPGLPADGYALSISADGIALDAATPPANSTAAPPSPTSHGCTTVASRSGPSATGPTSRSGA